MTQYDASHTHPSVQDIALIVGGGSSEYAVRMVKQMLAGLPPDYLA